MRRWTSFILLAAAFTLPAAAWGMASSEYPVVAPVVSAVSGEVTVRDAAASPRPATVGMLLNSGDTVRTGPGSRCEVSAATGVIRLYENTEMVIPQVADEGDKKDLRRVELNDGAGLFRIRKRGIDRGFEVKTPHIIAGVKGTLFAVQVDMEKGYSRVAVYSGQVEVTDTDRTPETKAMLPEGRIVEVTRDGEGLDKVEPFSWTENPWDAWEKSPSLNLTMPAAEPSGGAAVQRQMTTAPSGGTATQPGGAPVEQGISGDTGTFGAGEELQDRIDEDQEREDEGGCPPVTDGSGNPIIY